jgi:small-conductance mechanosensitive channel
MNWTLKDRSGRGIIKIGVSYGSDANRVREILLEIADKRREILSYPAPQVVFIDFGASSLDFELRYFLRDIGDVLSVGSAVRFEILERFRAEGVEIPFPQQDVHFRDIDRLADAIRDAGRGNAKPVIEPKDDIAEASAETGDGEGTDPATPPSTAKDENRDKDAAARSIPDAGGDADGDGPR